MECTTHRGIKESEDYDKINTIWEFNLVPNWESVMKHNILVRECGNLSR